MEVTDSEPIDLASAYFNPFYPWYELIIRRAGRPLKLQVSASAAPNIDLLNGVVEQRLDWAQENLPTIRGFCSDRLLATRNESWIEDEQEKVDRATFESQLNLERMKLDEDSCVTLTLSAGKLFRGHWIVVTVDAHGRLLDAYLEG